MATATYEYKVRDRAGKLKTGKLEAETPAQVAGKLKAMGYAPVSITQANTGLNKEITIPGLGTKKVKLKDLAVFSRQFATMINSGLSLLRALNILTEQTENKELGRVLGEVRSDIETGSSLSGVASPSTRRSSRRSWSTCARPARSAASSTWCCCRSPRTTRPRSSCAARSRRR